ncbi:MAG: hypothetical protein GQ574_07100 [Crocinitomix sp.]|nr:hypothetical protein [Crocinitomix sp.]
MQTRNLRDTSLIISGILSVLLYYYFSYFVGILVEYIFAKHQIYFIPRITIFEILAIAFIPFWSYLCYRPTATVKKIISTNLIIVLSLFLFIYLGGLFAMQFDNRISPLLPEYLVTEVFPLYWSVVLLVGISFPMLFFKPWSKRTNITRESISKELLDSD